MTGLCLLAAGALVGTLEAETFVLAWQHSVEKTRWEERYRVEGPTLILVEAYVEGSGAGMEVPAGAWRDGAGWRWRPGLRLEQLVLAGSAYGGDYRLCSAGACRALPEHGVQARSAGPVHLAACASLAPPLRPSTP